MRQYMNIYCHYQINKPMYDIEFDIFIMNLLKFISDKNKFDINANHCNSINDICTRLIHCLITSTLIKNKSETNANYY